MSTATAELAPGQGREKTGSPAQRFASRDPLAFAEPTGRDELWRFSPLAKLRPLFTPDPATATATWLSTLSGGASLTPLAVDDPIVSRTTPPVDQIAAYAASAPSASSLLRIPADAEIEEPLTVYVTGTGPELVRQLLVIEAGANSRATVQVIYRGSAQYAAQTSVLVGDGSALSVVQVMDWDADAIHVEHIGASLGRDSSYRHTTVSLGGAIVRLSPTVRYAGPGGRADLLGVSFAGVGQHLESRLYVEHSAPDCQSDVLYKNALLGAGSRTVWIGDVRIRPGATGTRTFEMNRNLLLSDGTRADSVPNLEIETGEIAGAGHASATGRFDDLQLFYLQSRGIDAEQARRLVVRGFFADVVERIDIPELENEIMIAIEGRLGFDAEELEN